MTKPNISKIAREHGISRQTVIRWRDVEGLDLGDAVAVAARAGHVSGKASADCELKVQRLRKITAEADRITMENRLRSGQLLDAGEVKESIIRCFSAARGEFLKMPSDMAPQLEGLSAAKINELLRKEVFAILTRLSDSTSDLYAR